MIAILSREGDRQVRALRRAGDRLSASPWQFGDRQHAIVVAIHRIEAVAQPVLVFGQRDAAVAVGIHVRQVVRRTRSLRPCSGARQRCERDKKTRPVTDGFFQEQPAGDGASTQACIDRSE